MYFNFIIKGLRHKLENKKLIPDKEYLTTVETIFEKYLELKSVSPLMNYLKDSNIKTLDRWPSFRRIDEKKLANWVASQRNWYNGVSPKLGIYPEKHKEKLENLRGWFWKKIN